jgi:hypothetical protein
LPDENAKHPFREFTVLPKPDTSENYCLYILWRLCCLQIHSLSGDLTPAERAALICDEAYWKRLCPKLHVGCS